MKVIFLDFDGVLNSEQFIRALYRKEGPQGLIREFCPIATSNLMTILTEVPDAQIVVSSSWRLGTSLEELQQILFEHAGVPKGRVIGKTPVDIKYGPRGFEIQAWLDKHPEVTKFVIIDDDGDMQHLLPFLVQTNTRRGLMIDESDAAVRMLEPTSTCNECPKILPWAGGGRCDACLKAQLKRSSI